MTSPMRGGGGNRGGRGRGRGCGRGRKSNIWSDRLSTLNGSDTDDAGTGSWIEKVKGGGIDARKPAPGFTRPRPSILRRARISRGSARGNRKAGPSKLNGLQVENVVTENNVDYVDTDSNDGGIQGPSTSAAAAALECLEAWEVDEGTETEEESETRPEQQVNEILTTQDMKKLKEEEFNKHMKALQDERQALENGTHPLLLEKYAEAERNYGEKDRALQLNIVLEKETIENEFQEKLYGVALDEFNKVKKRMSKLKIKLQKLEIKQLKERRPRSVGQQSTNSIPDSPRKSRSSASGKHEEEYCPNIRKRLRSFQDTPAGKIVVELLPSNPPVTSAKQICAPLNPNEVEEDFKNILEEKYQPPPGPPPPVRQRTRSGSTNPVRGGHINHS